jgi:hypothetical protein
MGVFEEKSLPNQPVPKPVFELSLFVAFFAQAEKKLIVDF